MEMTQEWIDQYNKKCAEFLGWKFFENSKRGVEGYPFGGHDGFETTSVWIKNPTQKYIDNPCHTHYEYLDGSYNGDISQKDLFDDYTYSLKFHSDWNWIMEVCIKLGMEFVITNKEQLILNIYDKLRSMETNTKL